MLIFQTHNSGLNLKHPILKNYKVQFLINQILKDEIEKKKFNYTKGFRKTTIKIIKINIKMQNKFYIWLKGEIEKKINLEKRLKNQNNKDQNWHKNINKFFIEEWNWK
jgi:hypothetical protein